MEEKIEILQHNLKTIRKFLDWRTDEISSELGISRQQINNLERGFSKMSKPIYLAINYLLYLKHENGDISDEDWKTLNGLLLKYKVVVKTKYIPLEEVK